MALYIKAAVAILGAGLAALQTALTDEIILKDEWVNVVIALLTAAAVYAFPNKPPA